VCVCTNSCHHMSYDTTNLIAVTFLINQTYIFFWYRQ